MPPVRMTDEQAQEIWGNAVTKWGYLVRGMVSKRVLSERKLEELGSSDVNCYAMGYIKNGLLNLDSIPYWTDEVQESIEA